MSKKGNCKKNNGANVGYEQKLWCIAAVECLIRLTERITKTVKIGKPDPNPNPSFGF